MKRTQSLKVWLAEVLVQRPEIINDFTSVTGVYAKLYEEWIKDIQPAFKALIKEIKSTTRQ